MELKSGAAQHVENASVDDEVVQKLGTIDKFGAHVKTDPREIALVKKLDLYMLASFMAKHSVEKSWLTGCSRFCG